MKKSDSDEKWYARMDEIESIFQKKIAETRMEYLGTYIRVSNKRSRFKHEIEDADNHQVQK